ncbi:MAG: hypothetical protein ACYC62_05320, partial [Coriobacteriia bacterium]
VLLVLGLLTGGCSPAPSEMKNEAEAPITASSPEPAPEVETPSPTVEVVWFWCDNDVEDPYFRFVAMIHNPGTKALVGLETEWVAYDAEGSIVGSFKSKRPMIPPGATIPYAGGAGGANLSGAPASAQVTVTNAGRFADDPPQVFAVSDVVVSADATNEYTVTARATSGTDELASAGIAAVIVLKNEAGDVIGGDFWLAEGLPEKLPPGSTFKIEVPYIVTTGPAVSADVSVVVEN